MLGMQSLHCWTCGHAELISVGAMVPECPVCQHTLSMNAPLADQQKEIERRWKRRKTDKRLNEIQMNLHVLQLKKERERKEPRDTGPDDADLRMMQFFIGNNPEKK